MLFVAFVGDVIVRPDARLKHLGLDLLHLVEETYPGVPVFLRPFRDVHEVFLEHTGFILRAPALEVETRANPIVILPRHRFPDQE